MLLPLPLGPTIAQLLPAGTCRSNPSRMRSLLLLLLLVDVEGLPGAVVPPGEPALLLACAEMAEVGRGRND